MLITSAPTSVGLGQTVKLFIAPSLDGKTVAPGKALLGLSYASSDTNVANPAAQANDDGSLDVTVSGVGSTIMTSQAQISGDTGVLVQNAQGTVTLTVAAAPVPPTSPGDPVPQDGGLLMWFTVS